jgi:hypothetical protein
MAVRTPVQIACVSADRDAADDALTQVVRGSAGTVIALRASSTEQEQK